MVVGDRQLWWSPGLSSRPLCSFDEELATVGGTP